MTQSATLQSPAEQCRFCNNGTKQHMDAQAPEVMVIAIFSLSAGNIASDHSQGLLRLYRHIACVSDIWHGPTRQLINAHLLHPLLFSLALSIPAVDDATVVIPFMTDDIPDLETYCTRVRPLGLPAVGQPFEYQASQQGPTKAIMRYGQGGEGRGGGGWGG